MGSHVGYFSGLKVGELGLLEFGAGAPVGLFAGFQLGERDAFGFVVGTQLGGFTGPLVGELVAFTVFVGALVGRVHGFKVGELVLSNFVAGAREGRFTGVGVEWPASADGLLCNGDALLDGEPAGCDVEELGGFWNGVGHDDPFGVFVGRCVGLVICVGVYDAAEGSRGWEGEQAGDLVETAGHACVMK